MNDQNDNQYETQQEKPETERKFSQEQYDMLKRCSGKRDMTEWNQYRKEYPRKEILLEGAKLLLVYLEGAKLAKANLKDANLLNANLKGAELVLANLEGASFAFANLEGADLFDANLEGAKLEKANLKGADLRKANLKGADLRKANLKGAELVLANLKGANLVIANLEGASFDETNIEGAIFDMAIVDGSTLITPEEFDRFTDFTGVGLDNARVEPSTKQLLKYNVRRLKWEQWYKGTSGKEWNTWIRNTVAFPVRGFWWVSDYGLSTGRIALTFFSLAILFALVYYFVPGLIYELHVTENCVSDFIRACYFSIVTMTTLGFGDMYAEPGSKIGHILLIVQVLLGYILLAALVTRFAVLFTVGGPAGSFPKKKSKKVNETNRDKNTKDQS